MPRIAVIDDDAFMRDLLRIHLSGVGLTVDTFEDAATGIRAIMENRPDLVVLDIMLPDLGGIELLAALKFDEATKNIPVVMLTSITDDNCFMAAKRLGANAFLNKPVSREDLIGTVLKQLSNPADTDAAPSSD